MPALQRITSILLANVLLVAAVTVFASGFFPYKAVIPGLARWKYDSRRVSAPAPFDKVVFMVVDALRSDFVYSNSSNFHFTQGLIRNGGAVPFTGHASAPTITMPRVKAITTGSVPSFVDLVLNFAESDTSSTLAWQDSWLAQLRAKKTGKLVMYGDDTWLRLFPGFFDRADGTTSFFVSDFTEVDNNVTRHIDTELKNDEWTAMTLHYLGLDHIGHKTGPRGPNMPAKQAEMDGIVQRIYGAMETEKHLASALLVLLGDHGMNEAGNHGANSAGEVSTALTLISPKLKSVFKPTECPSVAKDEFQFYKVVEQSDIAPTLAALMDFPPPMNNLGIIIPELLRLWPDGQDRVNLLYENAKQIWAIARATFPAEASRVVEAAECASSSSDTVKLRCLWQRVENLGPAANTGTSEDEQNLQTFLREAQSVLSGTASNYETPNLIIGGGLAVLSFVVAFITYYGSPQPPTISAAVVYALLIILYAITMFASSYVEEEHQFWYWFSGGYTLFLFFKASRFEIPPSSALSTNATTTNTAQPTTKSPRSKRKTPITNFLSNLRISLSPRTRLAVFLALTTLTKRLHQTGQKHSGSPHDLLTQLLLPYPYLLWTLIFATYILYSRRLSSRASTRWLRTSAIHSGPSFIGAIPVLIVISTLAFKVAFTAADAPELVENIVVLRPLLAIVKNYPLVNLARLGFMGLAQMLACAVGYEKPWRGRKELLGFVEALSEIISLGLMMQTRTVYIVVFLAWELGVLALGVGGGDEESPLLGETTPKDVQQRASSGGNNVLTTHEISILSILMQHTAFFAMGGTNAISTIDLSNAYNGVKGYNVAVVGLLTFVSNWAGSIWWSLAIARLLLHRAGATSNSSVRSSPAREVLFEHFVTLTVFVAASVSSVMVACFVLREHLFIWTVFSPKYLYMVAWTFGQHLFVNGFLVTVGAGLLAGSK